MAATRAEQIAHNVHQGAAQDVPSLRLPDQKRPGANNIHSARPITSRQSALAAPNINRAIDPAELASSPIRSQNQQAGRRWPVPQATRMR